MVAKNTPRFTPVGFPPTAEQIEIQVSRAKSLLIEANAGAAKTTTLALRVGEALARGLSPREILILVFTPEAEDVMRKRLVEIGIPIPLASQISVKTFDEFATGVLNTFDGYEPKAIDSLSKLRSHAIAAIEHVGTQYESKFNDLELATHSIAISQFLDAQLSIKASMSSHQDHDGMDIEEVAYTVGVTLTHWLTFLAYERLRCGVFDEAVFRGVFDATYDLARRLADLPELQAALPVYRLLLCDELHDLNEAAFRILMALLSDGRTYFVGAGDKDQVIYATVGADAQYLQHRFDSCCTGLVRLPLSATYRYGPHLALSVGKLKQKQSTSPLALITKISEPHYKAGNHEECARLVVDAIATWNQKAKGRCAVLIRDRHQSIHVENALMQAGIGYESRRMKKYLQRDEILFLRGMIAIALRNLESVKSLDVRRAIVEALVTFAEVEFEPDPDYPDPLEYAMSTIAEYPDTLNMFFSGKILNSKSKIRRRISDVVEFVETLPNSTRADDALRAICKRMDLESLVKRIYVYPYEASVVSRSIEGFITSATTLGKNIKEFSEWVGEAENASHEKKRHSVTLECVANSKGMEFDHVILPFLEVGQFPDPSAKNKQEENLFYVGVTRAKHALTLLTPTDPGKRSPFVHRMAFDAVEEEAAKTIANAVPVSCRTDLKVPFASKDEAKNLGARWDAVRKVWWVEAGGDLRPFQRWIK